MNNESMVYLNKVFSDLQIRSCPLMSSLTADAENFDQQLTFSDSQDHCGCGCSSSSCLEPDGDLNFVIDSTEVIVSDFDLTDPSSITPCQVTANGIPVDAIDYFNERYMASTNELMSRVSDCICIEKGLPTRTFFLISCAGGFRAKLTIVLRGSVFGCGGCKRFRLLMTTKDNVFVNIPGQTTFASPDLCLPCTTGGIAPVINFSFAAKATLLNPVITAGQTSSLCGGLQATGCLVTEPIAEVQVTRQTLFKTDAESINVPCDELEKCRQFPGNCGEADDDSNALPLHGRCCEDSGNGGHNHNCTGCGCSTGGTSCGNSCSCGNEPRRSEKNSISFQFNGRNGCSF